MNGSSVYIRNRCGVHVYKIGVQLGVHQNTVYLSRSFGVQQMSWWGHVHKTELHRGVLQILVYSHMMNGGVHLMSAITLVTSHGTALLPHISGECCTQHSSWQLQACPWLQ